jgi:hypothetical protein
VDPAGPVSAGSEEAEPDASPDAGAEESVCAGADPLASTAAMLASGAAASALAGAIDAPGKSAHQARATASSTTFEKCAKAGRDPPLAKMADESNCFVTSLLEL